MKFIFLLLFWCLLPGILFAQSCKEVDIITSSQKRDILREYIADCNQKHYFFEGMGVVRLVVFQDAEGQYCWQLSALIDTRYRAAPPSQYAWFHHDIILIYQGTTYGNPLPGKGDKEVLNNCLADEIGGRLYEYNPKPAYAYFNEGNGVRVKSRVTVTDAGNVHNSLIIRFNKDGTITKTTPA